jgi:hypothetical protein
VPVRDDKGKIVKWIGTCTDIEDHKLTEEALARVQAELESRVAQNLK